jgi:hypothetical protein
MKSKKSIKMKIISYQMIILKHFIVGKKLENLEYMIHKFQTNCQQRPKTFE